MVAIAKEVDSLSAVCSQTPIIILQGTRRATVWTTKAKINHSNASVQQTDFLWNLKESFHFKKKALFVVSLPRDMFILPCNILLPCWYPPLSRRAVQGICVLWDPSLGLWDSLIYVWKSMEKIADILRGNNTISQQ